MTSPEPQLCLRVSITRHVDAAFPGRVECQLVDAAGLEHVFVEKVPVVTNEDLDIASPYPRPGVIACTVVARPTDASVVVDTDEPWGVESTRGQTRFEVRPDQVVDLELERRR